MPSPPTRSGTPSLQSAQSAFSWQFEEAESQAKARTQAKAASASAQSARSATSWELDPAAAQPQAKAAPASAQSARSASSWELDPAAAQPQAKAAPASEQSAVSWELEGPAAAQPQAKAAPAAEQLADSWKLEGPAAPQPQAKAAPASEKSVVSWLFDGPAAAQAPASAEPQAKTAPAQTQIWSRQLATQSDIAGYALQLDRTAEQFYIGSSVPTESEFEVAQGPRDRARVAIDAASQEEAEFACMAARPLPPPALPPPPLPPPALPPPALPPAASQEAVAATGAALPSPPQALSDQPPATPPLAPLQPQHTPVTSDALAALPTQDPWERFAKQQALRPCLDVVDEVVTMDASDGGEAAVRPVEPPTPGAGPAGQISTIRHMAARAIRNITVGMADEEILATWGRIAVPQPQALQPPAQEPPARQPPAQQPPAQPAPSQEPPAPQATWGGYCKADWDAWRQQWSGGWREDVWAAEETQSEGAEPTGMFRAWRRDDVASVMVEETWGI